MFTEKILEIYLSTVQIVCIELYFNLFNKKKFDFRLAMGLFSTSLWLTAGLMVGSCNGQPLTKEEQNRIAAERIKAGAPVFDTRYGIQCRAGHPPVIIRVNALMKQKNQGNKKSKVNF